MPDTSWRVAELDPERSDLLVELFEAVWPSSMGFQEDVRWAFREAPQLEKQTVAVTVGTGIPIGARGSIRWPLALFGEVEQPEVHQLHGTCVHPDFRRQGIFNEMNRVFLAALKERGGDAVFNVSVAASRAGYEQLGWTYLPGLRRLVLPNRPIRIARALRSSRGTLRGPATPVGGGDGIPDGGALAEFLSARRRLMVGKLATDWSAQFMRWRYSRTDRGYRFVMNDAGLLAYRVEDRAGLKDITVGDAWVSELTLRCLGSLLKELRRREQPDLVSVVITESHPLYPLFRKLSFFRDPKGDLNLGVRPVTIAGRVLLISNRWALMTADIDTF